MSSEAGDPGVAIEAWALGKRFSLFHQPSDRLKQLLWGRWRQYSRDFWALQDVSFEIRRGEVVGLVGRNGAGKSTLLQMVCGTLAPTTGSLAVRGRVAALLELGAGFSPDFSGLENVYMNAAILGMERAQVDERLDGILAFADIGDFIHQPVKTYSRGMFVRLAFAVATSVEPDILVIDEALSVGDGAFARKSFDRIMQLKDNGATILFCSHAMYHVQALCSRALWLDKGRVRAWGEAVRVTTAYETALIRESVQPPQVPPAPGRNRQPDHPPQAQVATEGGGAGAVASAGTARIVDVQVQADGETGRELMVMSARTDVTLDVHFSSDPALPCPSVAVTLLHANGVLVASAGNVNDGVALVRDARGRGVARLVLQHLPLLQGEYHLGVLLLCERGLHPYETADRVATLHVQQQGLEQGLVTLAHYWEARS